VKFNFLFIIIIYLENKLKNVPEDVPLSDEEILRILREDEEEKAILERYKRFKYQVLEINDNSEEEERDAVKETNELEESVQPIKNSRRMQEIYAMEQADISDKIKQHAQSLADTHSSVSPPQYYANSEVPEQIYSNSEPIDINYEKHAEEQKSSKNKKNPFKNRVDDHFVNQGV
jgi:hypothetical protein